MKDGEKAQEKVRDWEAEGAPSVSNDDPLRLERFVKPSLQTPRPAVLRVRPCGSINSS
jgi:hypothetical protein